MEMGQDFTLFIQKWSKMTLEELYKERDQIIDRHNFFPDKSVSVKKNLEEILAQLEIYIESRENQRKNS